MIRLKFEELETIAKHIPDAEDACERARTTLSRELSSLAMALPGVSTPAIEALRDELVHWLRRYEDKLNEVEELLYRTAAAMRQADQTLADNMKEFGLELLGWYDVQRVFGEYDPITGERLSMGDRLLAGGMLLASIFPPAKGADMAGKAAIKGAKAIEAASVLSKMKHVVCYDKIKAIFETIYQQVMKAPFAETARLFKKQWDDLVESVASTAWQPVYAGIGPTSRVWMNEARNEVKDAALYMMKKIEGEAIDSIPKSSNSSIKGTGNLNRREALNQAKNLAGIPRSQQPTRQWQVGDDINKKGGNYKNYEYSSNPTHHGRYYEYDTPQGKRVIVDHTNDGRLHVHAGKPKEGANPFDYDFKKERYANIYSPNGDNHIYYNR
ncbi:pre-toxin TG domain-containing protein [Anoxybacillus rupiensis]|uniref:Pre-toxin TG domain-containing protein n=1 Tax=Anoxybacteroides rupiense TaxID=311460 RepID=A0ABT5W8D3_9BACL|nr:MULTISPECIES: pre-toxin TG domain-containing protein [Anoxybacillus]MDE8565582.1 pre-toxin TG domain-containing protein [Anoxybacillus rupiensis]QHC03336.1 hypothetical protein GRQ40_04730 [Anoxybacillus sp. PDR2]